MKLLLDANLSWRMLKQLEAHYSRCYHVDRLPDLTVPAKDSEIWSYARNNEMVIVTNDEDFIDLINTKGFPPKVVLLKTGNQSTFVYCTHPHSKKEEIEAFASSTDTGLLEIITKDYSVQ